MYVQVLHSAWIGYVHLWWLSLFRKKHIIKVFVIQSNIFWMKYKAVLEMQYCALISLHLVHCIYWRRLRIWCWLTQSTKCIFYTQSRYLITLFCVTFCDITNTAWWIKISQYHRLFNVRKKAKIRNRYNQVPHLTQDTEWESDKKKQENITYKKAKRSALPDRWPQGCNKQTSSICKDKHKKQITKKIHCLGTVSKNCSRACH